MRRLLKVFPLLIAGMVMLAACVDSNNDGDSDAVNPPDESPYTLTVINNTSMDLILFQGSLPTLP